MIYPDDIMDVEQRLAELTLEAQEVGPDGLGVNDHLSRLPVLCLLEVFRLLKRKDIHNVAAVNRRIHPVTKDGSLDKMRWEDGTLNIYQTSNGYGFYLIVGKDCPWKRTDLGAEFGEAHPRISYHYEICKDANGIISERKFTNGFANEPDQQHFYPHHWSIPNQFFNALAEILSLHEAKTLQINGIAFETPSFFEQLQLVFAGRSIELLDCNMQCVKSHGDVFKLSKQSFAQLIMNVRRVDLTKSNQIRSFISEAFLNEITSSKIVEFRDTGRRTNGHFFLRETMFPALIRLDSFEAPAMALHRDSFTEFCMMYMDARRSGSGNLGTWTFSVHPPPSRRWLNARLHDVNMDYEYTKSTGSILDLRYDCFLVSSHMTACIKADGLLLWNTGNANCVTVDFRDNTVDIYNDREDSDYDYNSDEEEEEKLEYDSGEDVEDEEMEVDDESSADAVYSYFSHLQKAKCSQSI